MDKPFQPGGATVEIDVSNTTQAVQVGASKGHLQVRIMNNGTATVWLRHGASTVTVTATTGQANTGFPVGPGVTEVLSFPSNDGALYLAAIAAASTGKVYFTPGSGF